MTVCAFSGEEIEPGTGIMYVKKDGSVFHYKNRMCFKNHQRLGRADRYTRWTAAARQAKAERKAGH